MKQCNKCGEYRENSKFSKTNRICNKCRTELNKKYKYNREYNKEYYRKYHKEYRIKCKDRYGISVSTIYNFGLKTALFVYDRAKRMCEQCGSYNDLTIHHKDGNGRHKLEKGLSMNNDLDNLQVLCRRCHGSIHGKERWSKTKIKEDL